jgi:hypothetical protein
LFLLLFFELILLLFLNLFLLLFFELILLLFLILFLGGAAVYRCDKRAYLIAALAAEGNCGTWRFQSAITSAI